MVSANNAHGALNFMAVDEGVMHGIKSGAICVIRIGVTCGVTSCHYNDSAYGTTERSAGACAVPAVALRPSE